MLMKTIKKKVSDWCIPICLTFLFFYIAKFVLLLGYVPTSSMEPTVPQKSIIVGLRNPETISNGDVVIFRHEGNLLVKRIAAVPGDSIHWAQIEYMNCLPIPPRESTISTVPENHYFVLGDNTQNSIDSRYWETPFVPHGDIVAKLLLHFPLTMR